MMLEIPRFVSLECDECHKIIKVEVLLLGTIPETVGFDIPKDWENCDGTHYCPECEEK